MKITLFIFILAFLIISQNSIAQCYADYKVFNSKGEEIGNWIIDPSGITREASQVGNDYFYPVERIDQITYDDNLIYFTVNGVRHDEYILIPPGQTMKIIYKNIIRILFGSCG